MSLDNFDELKLEIIDWSHRKDIDLKVDTFIELAEVEMFSNPTKTLKVRSGETRATATASTTSRFLALPSGFLEMRRLRIDADEGFLSLTYRTPEQLHSTDGPARPRFFTVTSQIEFNTVPDEAYTIESQYLAEFTPLSSSNQTNIVLTLDPNIYLFGALKEVFSWSGDTENQVKYELKFINAIRGANKKFIAGKFGQNPVMKLA